MGNDSVQYSPGMGLVSCHLRCLLLTHSHTCTHKSDSHRILSYLFSAYNRTNYKWGFFAIGTVAYIALAFSTLAQGHRGARRIGYSRDHAGLAGWMNLI